MELPLIGEVGDLKTTVVGYYKHWQFGNKKQLAFLEDLYTLINDGIPANRAVDMMSQVSTGLTTEVAASLTINIGRGQPLA
jgi:hypothetical protein